MKSPLRVFNSLELHQILGLRGVTDFNPPLAVETLCEHVAQLNINGQPRRDPRWGRGQETPGEDTFHLKSYVASLIDGLQGGHDPAIKKVIATCKHFVAYDLEVWENTDRYNFDAIVTTQDLAEYYFQPFQTCARDAAVG